MQLVLHEDAHEVLVLTDVGPVVVLGDAAVLAGGQTQPEADLALDVAARSATLQRVPLVDPRGRDVLKQSHVPRSGPQLTYRHCRTGQTDFDVTFGQCAASDRNVACAILIRHKTPSDGEDKVCLLPWQRHVLSHCRRTVLDSGSGRLPLDGEAVDDVHVRTVPVSYRQLTESSAKADTRGRDTTHL